MKPTRVRIFALYLALTFLVAGTVYTPGSAFALLGHGSMCTTSFAGPDPVNGVTFLGGVSTFTFFPCNFNTTARSWSINVTNLDGTQAVTCSPSVGNYDGSTRPICTGLLTGIQVYGVAGSAQIQVNTTWYTQLNQGGPPMGHTHTLTN